ncbi:unnamed protein product [Urochloa humidicola]
MDTEAEIAAQKAKEKAAAEAAASSKAPVEVHRVREFSGPNTWPMLTRTNYGEWSVHMKWKLKARHWWKAVEGGDAGEDAEVGVMEALLASTPAEYHEALGGKDTAKEAWDMLASFRLGSDRARKAKAQQLRREFNELRFKTGETVEDFALRLQTLAGQLATFGKPIDDEDVVAKLLRVVPPKYAQLALSIETMLDLSTLSLEDVTGRLRAVEDRAPAEKAMPQLMLTEDQWVARWKEKRRNGEGSSTGGGGGKKAGKAPADKKKGKKKFRDPNACRKCGEVGHWARECPNKKPEKEEVHLARDDSDDDDHALLMGEYCALQDGEAEEAVAEQGTAPPVVHLDEPRARVHLGAVGDELEQRWYLDSGASNHMTGCRATFSDLDASKTGTVKFGDGSRVNIRGQGTVVFRCRNGEQRALTDVYYIPQLRASIVSLGQLDERGAEVLIRHGVLRIKDAERRLLAKITRSKNRLYRLDLKVEHPVCLAAACMEAPWLWHGRFGHLSFDALGRLSKMVTGLPEIKHAGELCDSCLAGKQRRLPFPKAARYRAADPLELVHGDLCGPITPATHGGRRYFLLLVDDCSRFMWLQLLSNKSDAADAIKAFKTRAEAESGKRLRVLRTDRGGEFTAEEFAEYCAEEGVRRHLTAPYTPQQNGVVERRNQTIVGMARSMMKAKKMPVAFWGEAVTTAVFILNRSPTKALKGKTPYEAWHGRKPNVSYLRTFGCIGHVKNTKPGLGKLEDRSTRAVFLDYEDGSKAYRLYDPVRGKVVVSRDVVFDEAAAWDWAAEEMMAEQGGGLDDTFVVERLEVHGHDEAAQAPATEEAEAGEPAAGEAAEPAAAEVVEPPSQPGAGHQGSPGQGKDTSPVLQEQGTPGATVVEYATPPSNISEFVDAFHEGEEVRFRRMDNVVGDAAVPGLATRILDDDHALLLMSAEEPATFAIAERDAAWRKAMLEEMKAIEENETWDLVDPPAGCRPIGLKWVFKVKRDERGAVVKHKARLVARGFVQREGIDFEEVFAPVARMESVRLLLALAAAKDWQIHHLDIKSAFLNGDLAETVFVKQAPGFVVKGAEHKVLRLRKALYGLRQAPRAWNAKLDATMMELGFTWCVTEHALYTRRRGKEHLIVGVYVDDLIVTGARAQDIASFKEEMAARFRMSDLGALSYYLGIEVKQGEDAIKLGQRAYAQKLLERAGMAGCKAVATPIEERIKLSKESTAAKVDATLYRSIVGGLRWLTHTRPDIAFAVGYVSRFMEDPREDHWTAVKRLLRYVQGTMELGIVFPKRGGLQLTAFSEAPPKAKDGEPGLTAFSDADMAGDVDGRRSTSGVLVFLGGAPIAWQSLKQKTVALSTCEAEYVAAATAACQVVWLRRLLGELTGVEVRPPALKVDNQPAIALAKNPVLHDRSKHIDVKFHFLRDCVDGGQLVIEFVETGRQLADILTKSLGRLRFMELRGLIGMVEVKG